MLCPVMVFQVCIQWITSVTLSDMLSVDGDADAAAEYVRD